MADTNRICHFFVKLAQNKEVSKKFPHMLAYMGFFM